MKISKLKEKITLHPIMTIILLIAITIIISGILSLLGFQTTTRTISPTSLEYSTSIIEAKSLFSFSGLKYIFTSTVSNFIAFAPLSSLLIILIGIGMMEKSGFLKTACTLLTKNSKKITVTYVLVLLSIIIGVIGDLSFAFMIPLSALLFKYGKRNPAIGIIASFAGLTCGSALNIIFSSTDSSLLSLTALAANMELGNHAISTLSFLFIELISIILLSLIITFITEKYLIYKLDKYEIPETDIEEEISIGKKEKKGLIYSIIAGSIYIIFFMYCIIPGLPLSGKLLDHSQIFYIDKLFSYNSFFTTGFVFVVTMFFIILGFFYGLGAKTIKNNKEFCENLGHSLDGIGQTIVLIFFISIFINIFKYTNIGQIIVGLFAEVIRKTTFTGVPLIILLFFISALSTIVLPSSISKWSILSGVTIPVFIRAGMSPEFAQMIFRFGETITMGLTPLLAYYIIYLAYLEKYNQNKNPINVIKSIRYQIPYAAFTMMILLTILIIWFIVGLPVGIGVYPTL